MRGAVVTGSASGIGAAMAEALVKAGHNVVLFDVNSSQQTLDKVLAIRARSAVMIKGDVRKLEDIRAAIKACNDSFGSFRVLINSAGIAEAPGYPFNAATSAEIQRVIDINFSAIVHFTSEACLAMRKSGQGGVIVNLASAAGTIPIPYQPIYAATKAAVIHLTRSLEALRASDNIRVCALAPTFIDTPMVHAIDPAMRENLITSTGGLLQVGEVVNMLMRFVTEEEHAGVVLKMVPGKVFPFPRPEAKRPARL